MDHNDALCIADIQFNILTGALLLPKPDTAPPAYRQFLSDRPMCSASPCVDVVITAASPPDIKLLPKTFGIPCGWGVYGCPDESYVAHEIPSCTDPLWIARLPGLENSATLFCGPQMMDASTGELLIHPLSYPLDQILMMHLLGDHRGVIVHAAGWKSSQGGWIFPGKSGAGKTTLARLMANACEGDFLSDDRIIVRKIDEQFRIYGTPWPGEAGFAVNDSAPLQGIFFITQGSPLAVRRLMPSEAVSRILPVMSIPWYDSRMVEQITAFCDDLLRSIPVYQLTFTPDGRVVNFLKGFIHGS